MGQLHLLCGRAGSGKTRKLVQHVAQTLCGEWDERAGLDPSHVWLVLPTRAMARRFSQALLDEMRRRQRGPNGGAAQGHAPLIFGTAVHTLPTLSLALLDLLGKPRPRTLPTSMRPALVAQAMHDVAEELPEGALASGRADLRGPMTGFVAEVLRNRVSLDALAQAPSRLYAAATHERGRNAHSPAAAQDRELARRCEWLVALVRRYLDLCDELGRVNPEELPRLAADALREQGARTTLAGGLRRLYLDGFTRLADAELDLLGLLVDRAEESWATLCVPGERVHHAAGPAAEAANENRAFSVTERTRNELHDYVGQNTQSRRTPIQEAAQRRVHRFHGASLAWLEQELFQSEPLGPDGHPVPPSATRQAEKQAAAARLHQRRDLVRIVAPTMLDECEAIAGQVRRLHRERGLDLTRVGVIVREMSGYAPLLREAFARAEVELFLPRTLRLADTAAWWLCRDLLACALTRAEETGPVKELLRNPLFPVDATARLQNEARASGFVLQKEWLSPENYADPTAQKLVAEVSRVVAQLAKAAHKSSFEPAAFARTLLAGLRGLGLFALPLSLPGQEAQAAAGNGGYWAADPLAHGGADATPHAGGVLDPHGVMAESVRERVKAQHALQATIEGVGELLASPGIIEALLAAAERERERLHAAAAQVADAAEQEELAGASPLRATGLQDPLATADIEAAFGPARAFYDALREAARLRRIQLGETRPRRSVYAGDVMQPDLPDELEVVFVAGLMQGTFPPPPSTDSVLPERDRRRLSELGTWFEETRVQRELEDHLFYRAVTRATDELYLCHAERNAKGEEVLPSLYLRDVASAFGLELEELPTIAPVRRRLLLSDEPAVAQGATQLESGSARGEANAEATNSRTATATAAIPNTGPSASDPPVTEEEAHRADVHSAWAAAERATERLLAATSPAATAPPEASTREAPPALDEALAHLAKSPAESHLPWQALQTPDALLRWSVRTLWRDRPLTAEALASWHAAAAIWNRFHAERPSLFLAAQAGLRNPHRPELGELARAHIRKHPRVLSASGINMFANCPFAYFARYHLDLEEPQTAEPDAASWGTLHHTVLEELGQALDAGRVLSEPRTASEWAVERLVQLAGDPELGFPRLLTQVHWQAQLRHQAEKLRNFVAQEMEFRGGRATLPVGYEVPFGLAAAGELPEAQQLPPLYAAEPLTITDGEVELKLRGYIDLIEAEHKADLRNHHWAVVVDYKSGRVYYRARGLAAFEDDEALERESRPAEGYQGPDQGKAFDFQLPIYVLAAERLLGFSVAGAFFYSLHDCEKRGLYLENKREIFARRETNYRDEKSFARLEQLIHRAETMLLALARRLQAGEVTINPKECTYCPYQDVCRFHKAQVDVRMARRMRLRTSAESESEPTR